MFGPHLGAHDLNYRSSCTTTLRAPPRTSPSEMDIRPSSRSSASKPLRASLQPRSPSPSPSVRQNQRASLPPPARVPMPIMSQIPTRRQVRRSRRQRSRSSSRSLVSNDRSRQAMNLDQSAPLPFGLCSTREMRPDPNFDNGYDSDEWRALEYTSSSDFSSCSSASEDESCSKLNSGTSSPRPSNARRIPKKPSLFPVATRTHKRASFKEANRRRFGALFSDENDDVFNPNGPLAKFSILFEPVETDRCKPSSRRARLRPTSPKLPSLPAFDQVGSQGSPLASPLPSPGIPSSSSSSSTVPKSIFSSNSSESISTLATSYSSSSCLPDQTPLSKQLSSPPSLTIDTSLPSSQLSPSSPPSPKWIPVSPAHCPLVQHILQVATCETQIALEAESRTQLDEDLAFQASLIHVKEAESARQLRTAIVERKVLENIRPRSSSPSSGWITGLLRLGHDAYEENMVGMGARPLMPLSAARPRPPLAPTPTKVNPKPIMTAYGYRVKATQVRYLLSTNGDALSRPPSVTELQIIFDPAPASSRSRQAISRSPSRLPRPWNDVHPSPKSRASSAPSLPSRDVAYRRAGVPDQRFFRVFALENCMKSRVSSSGEQDAPSSRLRNMIGTRALSMCRPVKRRVEVVGPSPLKRIETLA